MNKEQIFALLLGLVLTVIFAGFVYLAIDLFEHIMYNMAHIFAAGLR